MTFESLSQISELGLIDLSPTQHTTHKPKQFQNKNRAHSDKPDGSFSLATEPNKIKRLRTAAVVFRLGILTFKLWSGQKQLLVKQEGACHNKKGQVIQEELPGGAVTQ